MITDPIADMLTRIRNGAAAKKTEVILPFSKFKQDLATILVKQGWIEASEPLTVENRNYLKLNLRYNNTGEPAISGLRRVSKPGQRIYTKVTKIPRVMLGFGSTIVSTPKGLMTDKEARKMNLGGEIVCQIW